MTEREQSNAACVWDESKHGLAPDGSVVVRFSSRSNPKPYYLQRVINAWESNRHYGVHMIHGEEFATLEEAKARAAELV